MEWSDLAEWWVEEARDPAYRSEVLPLLRAVLPEVNGSTVLEVGCGEGQVLRLLRDAGAVAFGMDLDLGLATLARDSFRGVLPSLAAVRTESVDAVVWEYFGDGWTDEPAGSGTVRFHHRPLSAVLESAAAAGWALERFEERPISDELLASDPSWAGHEHLPRLLGVRWRR
jgi:SAM-dependent methyltransferase